MGVECLGDLELLVWCDVSIHMVDFVEFWDLTQSMALLFLFCGVKKFRKFGVHCILSCVNGFDEI